MQVIVYFLCKKNHNKLISENFKLNGFEPMGRGLFFRNVLDKDDNQKALEAAQRAIDSVESIVGKDVLKELAYRSYFIEANAFLNLS